ncbi:MAG: hypothetical protein II948_02065 [Synergistaceae bacterium]|nr:hypothetical protein [Synergistaceae bacterium]MBQ9582481.1 hypothetical protein [Synergistaceae bacterium]MBR0044829.1 hypothetical protein [Synergistaceae bacterium]MBR0221565.1 hypothetical protein [Synergistaceae bacterium]
MSGLSEELMNKGIEKGVEKGRLEVFSDLVKLGRMTLDEVSKIWGIPVADIQNYVKNN